MPGGSFGDTTPEAHGEDPHLASLMAKIGARNRVEIATWAYETDLSPLCAYDVELARP